MKRVFFILALSFLVQVPVFANTNLESQVEDLKRIVQQLQKTVQTQQQEINALKTASSAAPIESSSTIPSPSAVPTSATRGRWNPDIGVIADTVLKLDSPKTDTEGADRISVREMELVLGSAVDPYSRFDASIGFSDLEEVHLSEAYLTRFALPLDSIARIGRFKPKVGKTLFYHRDVIETVDYPLVVQRYFGVDGLNKTGADVTMPLDLPLESSHEISFGVVEGGNGEGGTAFGDTRRRPTIYSHLRNFWDLSEVTTLEIGASQMTGSADADSSFETNIVGLDATFLYLYGPDQRLKLQSEFFYMNRDESIEEDLIGMYALADVRFHKQWSSGFRFDYVEPVNNPLTNSDEADIGYTGYLTFHQTEFARWRIQATHIDQANGEDDNQILVQGIFSIGEHKHKLA
jgi:hypothetical protein